MCKLIVFLLVISAKSSFSSEHGDFKFNAKKLQWKCLNQNNVFSCTQYKVMSYLNELGEQIGLIGNKSSLIRLVKLDNPDHLLAAREFTNNGGYFEQFLNFAQGQVNYWVSDKALEIDLPEGARAEKQDLFDLDHARRRRLNKVILPLIALVKIKFFLALIWGTLLIIKKFLFLILLYLPGYLKHIKPTYIPSPPPPPVHHYHEFSEDEHHNFGPFDDRSRKYDNNNHNLKVYFRKKLA